MVIAVVGILIGVLLPALASARGQAGEVRDSSGLRQLLLAYRTYASEHEGAVLVGYTKHVPPGTLEDGFGGVVDGFGGLAKKRYPWRLAPYLEHSLRGTLLTGERESLLKDIRPPDERTWWHYRISTMPSFGINAHFLGGYEYEKTSPPPFRVVERISQVRRPTHMLVFASARGEDWDPQAGGLISAEGWHTVDSPAWGHTGAMGGMGQPWSDEPYAERANPEAHGNVHARYRGEALVAMLDGHVEKLTPAALRDMTYWSNDAASAGDPSWTPVRR